MNYGKANMSVHMRACVYVCVSVHVHVSQHQRQLHLNQFNQPESQVGPQPGSMVVIMAVAHCLIVGLIKRPAFQA